jgi:hypothetical protein
VYAVSVQIIVFTEPNKKRRMKTVKEEGAAYFQVPPFVFVWNEKTRIISEIIARLSAEMQNRDVRVGSDNFQS